MYTPGLDDSVKGALYGGWNDQNAIQNDYAANGAKKYQDYLNGGGAMLGDTQNPQNISAYNSAQTNILGQKQQKAQTDLFNTESGRLNDFNTKFGTDVNNIIGATSQKFNLPGLTDIVNGLNSRISELSGNTSNNGAGGFASGDQVDKALNTNYLPRFQTAISNLNTSTGAAQQEENQLLTPDITQGQMLNDQVAREMTGFTALQQNQLQGYLGQLQAGTSLTEQQMSDANSLAIAQKNYDATIAQINAEKGAASYNFLPTSYGGGIFNPATNSFVMGGNSGAPSFSGGAGSGVGTTSTPSIANLESSNISNSGMSIPGFSGSFQPYNVAPTPSPSVPPAAITQSLNLLSGSNNNPNSLGFNGY